MRRWILGAADPEMTAIERLLTQAGEKFQYATCGGVRVHPGNAYKAELPEVDPATTVILVECGLVCPVCQNTCGCSMPAMVKVIDHHRPGDPGFGRPAAAFMVAASIGQVITYLAAAGALAWEVVSSAPAAAGHLFPAEVHGHTVWMVATSTPDQMELENGDQWAGHTCMAVPMDIVLTAAADHCLAAAYRGECPGVDPDELMKWRVASRAAFQGRTEAEVMADIEDARAKLQCRLQYARWKRCQDLGCPGWDDGCAGCVMANVADMRGEVIPELPEAACRAGVSYIAGPLVGPDGREKITCSGNAAVIKHFLAEWSPANGVIDTYGDPARGFAGGYVDVSRLQAESIN